MTIQSHAVLSESFTSGQIHIRHDPHSNRIIDPSIEAKIDEEWARQLEAAKRQGMTYYDSPAFRVNRFSVDGEVLTLHLAIVPYRVHAAMKTLHTDPTIREMHLDKVLVADALVHTADGFVLFGKVRKLVEETTYLIGGTCAPGRAEIDTADDLFAYVRERVADTLQVDTDIVSAKRFLGLIQNEVGCVNAIFDVRAALPLDVIRDRFRPRNGIVALEAVPAAGLAAYLHQAQGYLRAIAPLLP